MYYLEVSSGMELLNEYMLEIFISNLENDPKSDKIRKLKRQIRDLGKIAA